MITTEQKDWLENGSRKHNTRRRLEHPDWPSHKSSLGEPIDNTMHKKENTPIQHVTYKRTPHGMWCETVSEVMPVSKMKYLGYCKYCYTKHRNWWLMDQRDYHCLESSDDAKDALANPEKSQSSIILCGECEHTSMRCFT